MKTRVFAYLDEHRDEMLAFLRTLLSYNSVALAGDGGYPQGKAVADCLAAALEFGRAHGLAVRDLDGVAGLFELGDGTPKIGVLCHLDIVPAGEGWIHDPFAGEVENGVLYGRGTTDDKGPFVSALFALIALSACGGCLPHAIRLIAGTCEETGSLDIEHCKAQGVIPPHVFSPDANFPVVNTEKGIAHGTLAAPIPKDSPLAALSAGEVVNMVPQTARAVFAGEEILLEGLSAHASTPQLGDNALTRLLSLLGERDALLSAAAELFPHGVFDGSGLGVAAEEPIAGALTLSLNLAKIERGMLYLTFDARFPLNVTEASLREDIERRLADSPFSLSGLSVRPPHHVPADSALVTTLLDAYSDVTGREGYCIAIGGGTYVHDIEGGVAFGTVYPDDDCRIHSPEEFVRLDELLLNAKVFAAALLGLQDKDL